MNVHAISLKRLLGFWALTFLCSYVSILVLFTFYVLTINPLLFVLMQAATPLFFLLFGWLYFRRAENDWTSRLFVGVAWVVLMLLGNAMLMQPVYGYVWTSAFGTGVLQMQTLNVAAVLVAGWAARK